jgi:hypothetical protein
MRSTGSGSSHVCTTDPLSAEISSTELSDVTPTKNGSPGSKQASFVKGGRWKVSNWLVAKSIVAG